MKKDPIDRYRSDANGPIREATACSGLRNDSEAYHTGYEAHEQGEPRTANPYATGTWDSEQWFLGWDDAE